jgi:hypothetical protein
MIYSCNIKTTWINHVISILHDLDLFEDVVKFLRSFQYSLYIIIFTCYNRAT